MRKTVVCLQSPAVLSLSIDIFYCVCLGIIIVITFRLLLLAGTTFSGFWKLHIWWVQILVISNFFIFDVIIKMSNNYYLRVQFLAKYGPITKFTKVSTRYLKV